jgi:tRNA-binding protein
LSEIHRPCGAPSFIDKSTEPEPDDPKEQPLEMKEITWQDFEAVELRTGTVVAVDDFPQARQPAYKVTVDFGPEIGVRKTSARITDLYAKEELMGRQIVGVVNFPPKQIGPVRSEFLLTGFYREDGAVVIAVPERPVPNGAKLG